MINNRLGWLANQPDFLFTSNTILNYYIIHAGPFQGMPVNKVGDPNERKRTTRTLLCRRYNGDRAGEGVASIEAVALVLLASHDRQGPGAAAGKHRGALGRSGAQGQPAPSRQQRRGMEDAGEPQVERQGGAVLVSRRAGTATAGQTAAASVAAIAPRPVGSLPARKAVGFDPLLQPQGHHSKRGR